MFRETKPIGAGCVVSNKANPLATRESQGCSGSNKANSGHARRTKQSQFRGKVGTAHPTRLRNDSTDKYAKQSQLAGRRR